MKRDLVSVVIPTFNRAYCLPRTIDSVLSQTHPHCEIIVVDDGSTDGTGALLGERYGGEPRVRCVRQDNRGVSAARNRGFAEVRGRFVALLDSDDVWMPRKLELQLACLAAFPEAGMVWSDMQAIDPAGRVFSRRYLRQMYSAYRWFPSEHLFSQARPLRDLAPGTDGTVYCGDIFSAMVMGNLVHTSTVLLQRERLERVGGFNEALRFSGEDHDFHLRTCREGPVAFLDLPTIQYQRGMPDRLTRPEYAVHMARNFLRTITPVIERERHRIRLPERMLDQVRAEAHAWLGGLLLEQGEADEARAHLLRSLWYQPLQPKVAALALCASLPAAAERRLRHAHRALKQGMQAAARRPLVIAPGAPGC